MNDIIREPRSVTVQDALEVCLAALETGVNIQTCLLLYPELADELRPALEAAQFLESMAVEAVPTAAIQRSRAEMLGRAAQLRPNPLLGGISRLRLPRLALALITALLVFILGWNGLVIASAKSLPGEPLYPVKRAAENLRIQFAPSTESKHGMEHQYIQLRAQEVQDLLDTHRVASVSFEGQVNEISGDHWLIADILVRIMPETKFFGSVDLGMDVEVEGETQPDGSVQAREIHLREYRFSGRVESINPSVWRISGVKIQILSSTQIDDTIRVNDPVLVLVSSHDDGTLAALAILHLTGNTPVTNNPLLPSLTATLQPGASASPTGTVTEPTDTPEPTDVEVGSGNSGDPTSSVPQITPEPTEDGDPSIPNTPEPTEEHDLTHTPDPTEHHEVTSTPESTEIHDRTQTPHPTENHSTETHDPTEHPETTSTPEH